MKIAPSSITFAGGQPAGSLKYNSLGYGRENDDGAVSATAKSPIKYVKSMSVTFVSPVRLAQPYSGLGFSNSAQPDKDLFERCVYGQSRNPALKPSNSQSSN